MVFLRPKVMGILNVTPDSFSDGGRFLAMEAAVSRAKQMIEEGADIIDIGGESSGPDSVDVTLEEELKRVMGVVEKVVELTRQADREVWVSVDTYKSEVARQAIAAGVMMVNDVTAFRGDEQMATVIAESGVKVVLMYSKDASARTTRREVDYGDVVASIKGFLAERIKFAQSRGVKREQIILDPGMGAFVSAKPEYSYEILRRLREFEDLGLPILVGVSRKGFLGGKVADRLAGSLEGAGVAIENGAAIVRVHDVGETRRMIEERF